MPYPMSAHNQYGRSNLVSIQKLGGQTLRAKRWTMMARRFLREARLGTSRSPSGFPTWHKRSERSQSG
jgi:hypothetical protein